jgi:hypothetical protein
MECAAVVRMNEWVESEAVGERRRERVEAAAGVEGNAKMGMFSRAMTWTVGLTIQGSGSVDFSLKFNPHSSMLVP